MKDRFWHWFAIAVAAFGFGFCTAMLIAKAENDKLSALAWGCIETVEAIRAGDQ
jgi:hypothetical protein